MLYFWICIVFLLVLVVIILELICGPLERKIAEVTDIHKSILYRKRLKWFRLISTILSFVVLIALLCWDFYTDFRHNSLHYIIIGVFVKIITKDIDIKGNVSSYSKDKYLKEHSSFALFLRAFKRDIYGDDISKVRSISSFSEYNFIKIVNKFLPACAIGMLKEIDSPLGAKRVYISDFSWQKDVNDIMDRASIIFVVINDSPSCLWEIEQTVYYLHKTIFIIPDLSLYEKIHSIYKDRISFPEYDLIKTKAPFCVFFDKKDNMKYNIKEFKYSIDSYEEVLLSVFGDMGFIETGKITSYRRKKHIKTIILKTGLVLSIIFIVFSIIILLLLHADYIK